MSIVTKVIAVTAFIGVVVALFFLAPVAAPLPNGIASSFELVIGYLYRFDFILPVDALITTFTIAIGFYSVEFVWKLIKYVINIAKGVFGGGA